MQSKKEKYYEKTFVTFQTQCDYDGGKRGFHYFEEMKEKNWKKDKVEKLIIIQDTHKNNHHFMNAYLLLLDWR